MSRKPNQAYYDEFSATYEAERHEGYHVLIDELEAELVRRHLPADGSGRVLEAGCGTGLLLARVRPHARTAVGLDLSGGMLARAHRRGLPVVQGSITQLPFPSDHFDVVYSVKVLAHVERIEDALAEMARVTRPGGHVIAEFYNPYSLRYVIKRLKRPTAIGATTHDEAVFTRYDSLARVRGYLPPSLELRDVRGIRVVTPISHVHRVPLLGGAIAKLERLAADAPLLKRLGGFMAVVARKR